MERRLSYLEPEEERACNSQSDMHDFSISSLISNVSKLLEGNNSSFLVHVDSHRLSKSPTLTTSTSRKSCNVLLESEAPEVSEFNSPREVVLIPSTPMNRKLGYLEPNDDVQNIESSKREETSSLNFSVADLIAKAESKMNAKPFPLAPPIIPVCRGKDVCTNMIDSNETSETDDTERYLLSDLMKGIKNHLPIRRFPPPMLAAIFEQSCEDVSMSSRSRASSVASSVSKNNILCTQPVKAVNISGPTQIIPNVGKKSIKYSGRSSTAKIEDRVSSTKQDSKIPVPILMHSNKQRDKKLDFEASFKQHDFSSLTSFMGSPSQQTVLMVGAVDSERKSKSSNIGGPVSSSVTEWVNGPSINLMDVECQRSDDIDSWNEFDKIMDRSLPSKAWELHEFEELATEQKNQSVHVEKDEEDSFDYVTSEDARLLMDKDEEDRVQFLKSADVSFASNADSVEPAPGMDIFSMTNYFRLRSSFPIDNQANESSMFHDDYTARQEDIQPSPTVLAEKDSIEKDGTITPNSNTVLEQSESLAVSSPHIQTPSVLGALDSKTKNLARFLIGSDSNGMEKNSIMEHVLEMCKRRSSYGISNGPTPTGLRTPASEEQDVITVPKLLTKEREQSENTPSNSKFRKELVSTVSNTTATTDQTQISNPDCYTPTILKRQVVHVPAPCENKRLRGSTQANPPANLKNKASGQQPLHSILVRKSANKDDEIDKSIMLSEPGKVSFLDDIDTHGKNGFDEFKRNLMRGDRFKKDFPKGVKENLPPAQSAFVPLQLHNATEYENPLRQSVELLRRTAPSPPEKLVAGKSFISSTEAYQVLQTFSSNKMVQENPNHSTPIAAEPLSVQLAKSMSMCRDNSYMKSQQQTKIETTAQQDYNARNSMEVNNKKSARQPYVSSSSFRTSSTPNDFDQRALRVLPDVNARINQDTKEKQLDDSLRSVEVARGGYFSKQTTQKSIQEGPRFKDLSDEKIKRDTIESSMGPGASLSSSSALGKQYHPSDVPQSVTSCAHQNLPASSYPSAYGFPLSIHIHLPTMSFQQYPYQHGQSTGYPTGSISHIPASQSQVPLSSVVTCKCQFSANGNGDHGH